MKKYAFVDDVGVVVNCINGTLTEAQQQQFLRDYKLLFGAAIVVEVDDSVAVHPGGTYANGVLVSQPVNTFVGGQYANGVLIPPAGFPSLINGGTY